MSNGGNVRATQQLFSWQAQSTGRPKHARLCELTSCSSLRTTQKHWNEGETRASFGRHVEASADVCSWCLPAQRVHSTVLSEQLPRQPAGRPARGLTSSLRESSTADALHICTPSLVVSSSVDMYTTVCNRQ